MTNEKLSRICRGSRMKDIKEKLFEKKNNLMIIQWHDSAYFQGPIECVDIEPRFTMETVGFLIMETKTHYVLAHEKLQDGRFRNVTSIPKAVVLEMKLA